MVLIHLCRVHYCFDYIGLRFTATDIALGHQIVIKFFFILTSQIFVILTIKRRWLIWFCSTIFVLGISAGYNNLMSEVPEQDKQDQNLVSMTFGFVWAAIFNTISIYAMRIIDYEILKSHNLHNETKQQ